MAFSVIIVDAQDLMILRNGDEYQCKVEQLSDNKVFFQVGGESSSLSVDLIYMIKYASRGNAFFSETGEVTYSSKVIKPSPKDIFIYLCSGSEIRATELNITADALLYHPSGESGKKNMNKLFSKKTKTEWISISKDEIFFIRYPDGTRDIINNLQRKKEQARTEELLQCKRPFVPINKEAGYPVVASLVLNDGNEIPVIIYDSDRTYIHYRTKEWQDGPIYRMNRNKIKIITTK